jgi:CubicO group peptidase (beta-lactamase class C family)
MNIKFILLSLLLLGCSVLPNAKSEQLPTKMQEALKLQLIENEQRYNSVSQSILVKKQEKIIYNVEHGLSSIELATFVNENNQYPVYSLAKLFASVTLMNVVEKGGIDLDKSITFYLPQLPKHWSHVSVRHCLNHTSGLPDYFTMDFVRTGFPKTLDDVFNKIADQPFQFKMGDQNRYNQTNYIVIEAIIEKVTKHSYLDVVRKTVIEPLNLKNTFYYPASQVIPNVVSSYWGNNGNYTVDKGIDWPEYSFVHSGLYSNKADLQRFIAGVVDGKIISKTFLYDMWQPMKLNNGQYGSYASGWKYVKEDDFVRVGHGGGNRVRLDYHFKPNNKKENYTSIYLTNGNGYSNGTTTHLVDAVMSILSPSDFPTLVLQERILDGAFNNTLAQESITLFNEISSSPYINPADVADFVTERGYTLYYSSNPKNSIPLFEFYTDNLPSDAKGWNRLGEAWLAAGNKQKAIQYFRKSLSLNEQSPHIRQKINRLLE